MWREGKPTIRQVALALMGNRPLLFSLYQKLRPNCPASHFPGPPISPPLWSGLMVYTTVEVEKVTLQIHPDPKDASETSPWKAYEFLHNHRHLRN